jgi:ArsR family metal-binding transcriptional regulator
LLFQDSDSVEDEDIDKIDEIEVLKYLVQTFGGSCSFGEFVCSAAGDLFAGFDIKDWLMFLCDQWAHLEMEAVK